MTDIKMIRSSFGGGWAVPLSEAGRQALTGYYEEAPTYLVPIGEEGYIVEPYETADLAEYLEEDGVTFGA